MVQIGQQAPAFKGQAVVDGQIKEISSEDYKGAQGLFDKQHLEFDPRRVWC